MNSIQRLERLLIMPNYKIIITQRAFSDITENVLFVKNVSIEAAKELYKEIIASIQSLSPFPNKYPEIEGLRIKGSRIRKMTIHQGRYIVLYKVEDENVIIYDVIDVRRESTFIKI